MDIATVVTISIAAGLLIELFFQLVRYRDEANSIAPTNYMSFSLPDTYVSVRQYLHGGSRRFYKYFIFRLIPPIVVIVLLVSTIEKYSTLSGTVPFFAAFIAAMTSLAFRDIYALFKIRLLSERLLHVANIVLVLLVSLLISLLTIPIDMAQLAPSLNGMIDNLWSSLLAALLVVGYVKMSNTSSRNTDSYIDDIQSTNYVIKSYSEIKERYYHAIKSACLDNDTSVSLMYSVLIYENMNRPYSFRIVETFLAKTFRLPLTTGIAQVKSKKPLGDADSIRAAAKILKNTQGYIRLGYAMDEAMFRKVLLKYNKSKNYSGSVYEIYKKLSQYVGEVALEEIDE